MDYPSGFDFGRDNNRPICGVLAVALVAGVSLDVAFAACRRNMPAHRSRMRGSTYDRQRDVSLSQLGVRFTVLPTNNLSVIEFAALREDANDPFNYILEVRGHVLTLANNRLIDQCRNIHWTGYSHPRIKLKRIIRIDGKGW